MVLNIKGDRYFSCIILLEFVNIVIGKSSLSNGLVYRQSEVLTSPAGYFGVLKWTVNHTESLISFSLTRNATDADVDIVLGLSKTGGVKEADLVMITGNLNSTLKASSMYGMDVNTIEPNSRQLWSLNDVKKDNQQGLDVTVKFSRKLDSCALSRNGNKCAHNDMVHILWGSSKESNSGTEISKAFIPEGNIRTFLTDPQIVNPLSKDQNIGDLKTWRISQTYQIPKERMTSYRCNIHKAPFLSSPHNIVGFVPYFARAEAQRHIHHQLMYRCVVPLGFNAAEIFDPILKRSGYDYIKNNVKFPFHFCTELIYGYGAGGKPYFLPENVGIPLGERQEEYFLMETHYDNPEFVENLVIENGVDVLYTSKVRPVEGSMLVLGYGHLGLYMVPPNSVDFKIGGLCSSDCTHDMLAGKGVTSILGANLHAHKTTHKMRLRHFRGDLELPHIVSDENYDASFQQLRYLHKSARILPGDQLGVECVISTGNKTVVSGLSTKNDMCLVFVLLDKRLDYLFCYSEYSTKNTLSRYGIQKIKWSQELHERVITRSDNHSDWVGRSLQSVVDEEDKWSDENRIALAREQMYGQHKKICPSVSIFIMGGISLYRKLGSFRNRIPMTLETYTPVNTPGYMGGYTEWPKSNTIFGL